MLLGQLRIPLFFILMGVTTVGFSQPPKSNRLAGPEGSGSISGRITVDGSPVAGVRVFLVDVASSPGKVINVTAVSASDGKFTLEGVPAGRFTLTTGPGPYVFPVSAPMRVAGISVSVEDSQRIENLNVELSLGGVISGRIFDNSGQPLIGGRVSFQRTSDQQTGGASRTSLSQDTETDDRGVYRAFGLQPGKYILSVKGDTPSRRLNTGGSGTTTYYPGVPDLVDAVPIEVASGKEILDVDFSLVPPGKTYTARGVVVNSESNQPVEGLEISYLAANAGPHALQSARVSKPTNSNGEFSLEYIKPGRYWARVIDRKTGLYSEPLPFEVNDADIEGLLIKVEKGTSVSGSVSYLPGPGKTSQVAGLIVIARSLGPSQITPVAVAERAIVGPDGGFTLKGIPPGNVSFSVQGSEPNAVALLRTERDGVDMQQGIQVLSNAVVAGVRLVVVFGKGHIDGRIALDTGQIAPDAETLVSAELVDASPRRSFFARGDREGKFQFWSLPPGQYQLTVRTRILIDGRAKLSSGKQTVIIKHAETSQLVVRVSPIGK